MKRLTLFAVLAASLLAWAAPASAGKVQLVYYKADSIWARIGYTATAAPSLLSETGKFRHSQDSTGVLKNCGSCQRYWIHIVKVLGPDQSADTTATLFFSMRGHAEFDQTNDSLMVDVGVRPLINSTTYETLTPQDSTPVAITTNTGTDSTASWNEYRIMLDNYGTRANLGSGHSGRQIMLGSAYNAQMVANPSFKWRLAGTYQVGWPKLIWCKLYIYCYKEG